MKSITTLWFNKTLFFNLNLNRLCTAQRLKVCRTLGLTAMLSEKKDKEEEKKSMMEPRQP